MNIRYVIIILYLMGINGLLYAGDRFIFIESKSIDSKEMAYSRALEYSGFEKMPGFSPDNFTDAFVETMVADSTPFLSESNNGRQVWHIICSDLKIKSLKFEEEIKCERTIHIYLDSTSGVLIKIVAPYEGSRKDLAPSKGQDIKEKEITHNEVYTDYIISDSILPIYQILKDKTLDILDCAEFDIILVKRIDIHDPQKRERPVWIIDRRGVDEVETTDNQGDLQKKLEPYCIRNYFDAKTGVPFQISSLSDKSHNH